MSFYTAINCMDGRVQLPVISYIQNAFGVEYVDMITAPGPVRFFDGDQNHSDLGPIYERVTLSLTAHNSKGLVIVAHHDCAGNPVSYQKQINQLKLALTILGSQFPNKAVDALWVGPNLSVERV